MRHILVVSLVFALVSSPACAVDLTKEQKEAHPCLDMLFPGIPVAKAEQVPVQYRPWIGKSGIMHGTLSNWNGEGKNICSLIVFEAVEQSGFARVRFFFGSPVNRNYVNRIQLPAEGGELTLQVPSTGSTLTVTLEKGGPKAQIVYSGKMGRMEGVVTLLE